MPYQCKYCDKSFKNVGQLSGHHYAEHKAEITKRGWRCTRCNKLFHSISKLRYHLQEHEPEPEIDTKSLEFKQSQAAHARKVLAQKRKKADSRSFEKDSLTIEDLLETMKKQRDFMNDSIAWIEELAGVKL